MIQNKKYYFKLFKFGYKLKRDSDRKSGEGICSFRTTTLLFFLCGKDQKWYGNKLGLSQSI